MKNLIKIIAILLISSTTAFSQVGIGTKTPDASALLDVKSTTKGFLPPRLSTAQRSAISSPPEGLTIFNTTINCMEWWNATKWFNTCGITEPACTTPSGTVSAGGTILAGGTTSVTYTGSPYTSISWSAPGGNPSSGFTAATGNITYATAGTYTITFTATNTGGSCTTSSSTASTTVTVNSVTPPPCTTPSGLSVSGGGTINAGNSTSFTLSGSNISSVSWSAPGGNPSSGTTNPTGNITYATAGNYTITFTASSTGGACTTTTATASGSVTVTDPDAIRCGIVNGGGTSTSAYDAAPANTWVRVTAAEYDAIQLCVASSTTIGAPNSVMNNPLTVSSGYNGSSGLVVGSAAFTQLNPNNYLIGFQFRANTSGYGITNFGTNAFQISAANAILDPSAVFSPFPSAVALPATDVSAANTRYCHVLKKPNIISNTTKYLGICTSMLGGAPRVIGSYAGGVGTHQNPLSSVFETIPNKTFTMPFNFAVASTAAIQFLATPTKQW